MAKLHKKISAENEVAPWYYKSKGKIFEKDVLKEKFKIRNGDTILNKFKRTRDILEGKNCIVHADWSGFYFLTLAALPGISFHEKSFKTEELYRLREFVEKEKPKGAVLSYITSDKDCPIHDINLEPILNLFDIPELKYLKLLFVSKVKTVKRKNSEYPVFEPIKDNKVEWILAYSK